MVSVVIPIYKEPYLNKTLLSLLGNAEGEVEILPVFDGERPDEPLPDDPRIRPIFMATHAGMRSAINNGILRAKGEWIMKTDAHCAFAKGWDTVLTRDSKPNWLMIPRRYSLNDETWERMDDRPTIDYHYLSFPGDESLSAPEYGYSFQVIRTAHRAKPWIDDTMTFQGSCWFANREYFMKHIYPLDDVRYGSFAQEQQEIGLKYWLGGGAVKVNKHTWYAHLSKRKTHYLDKGFSMDTKRAEELKPFNEWATKHWLDNLEPNMIHDFAWLIEKFKSLNQWPEDWQKRWNEHLSAK